MRVREAREGVVVAVAAATMVLGSGLAPALKTRLRGIRVDIGGCAHGGVYIYLISTMQKKGFASLGEAGWVGWSQKRVVQRHDTDAYARPLV